MGKSDGYYIDLYSKGHLYSIAFSLITFNVPIPVQSPLKHTTTLFSLFDHYILSRKWRVIVDQVQTNYHGRPMVL